MSALGGSTATPTAAPSDGFWHFSDGAPVTIVAGVMPNDGVMSSSYTDPASPDYVELYTYSDPDSLLELHGHIRAANPDSQVNFFRSDQLDRDHLTTHLVLLGGVDVNVLVPEVVAALGVPVHQNIRDNIHGGFAIDGVEKRFEPTMRGANELTEDIAHFCRGLNPFNSLRTVTICNGMFGRGTYGAVRALTDARFRDRNTRHIRMRFPEDRTFSILARVRIIRGEVVTPDWTRPDNILHEWSEADQ